MSAAAPPTQEAERRFANNGPGHPERRLHHDGRDRRRDDVPPENSGAGRTERPRRLDVLELARPQYLSPHESGVADPADNCQGEQDVDQTRSEHSDERDREQQSRERQQHIGDAADTVVDRPAEVAGDGPEQRANTGGDDNDRQTDEKRDACAGENPRENVPTELVEAERVRQSRTRKPQRQLLRRRIKRHQPRSNDRRERGDNHDDRAQLQHPRLT